MALTDTQQTITEIYDITFQDGSTAYYTSLDNDIAYNSHTYKAIPIKRSKMQSFSDLQVDKLTIEVGIIGVTIGSNSYTMFEILKRDFLRNAHIVINLIDYVALNATWNIFEGWITDEISYDQGVLTLTIGSILDKLQEKFPKFLYTELCQHQLYGSYCGLTKASYKVSGTLAIGSTTSRLYSTVFNFANHASGYWNKGEVIFSSGNNNGVKRSVINHQDGYIDVLIPLFSSVSIGDGFDAYPGCDKTGLTCDSKFSNYTNFLGFEYIPKPEILYSSLI